MTILARVSRYGSGSSLNHRLYALHKLVEASLVSLVLRVSLHRRGYFLDDVLEAKGKRGRQVESVEETASRCFLLPALAKLASTLDTLQVKDKGGIVSRDVDDSIHL